MRGLRGLPHTSRCWKHGPGWQGFSMHKLTTSLGGLMTVMRSMMSGGGVGKRRVMVATRPWQHAGTVMTWRRSMGRLQSAKLCTIWSTCCSRAGSLTSNWPGGQHAGGGGGAHATGAGQHCDCCSSCCGCCCGCCWVVGAGGRLLKSIISDETERTKPPWFPIICIGMGCNVWSCCIGICIGIGGYPGKKFPYEPNGAK